MRLHHTAAIAGALTLTVGIPSVSAMQRTEATAAASPYTYADIADLATAAPIALHARIHSAAALKAERAPGVAAGHTRFYVEADVVSLIRGRGPLAARISYLVDLPNDARGKPAKLRKKQPVLLFARPVAGAAAGGQSPQCHAPPAGGGRRPDDIVTITTTAVPGEDEPQYARPDDPWIYRGTDIPELTGRYIFGDYSIRPITGGEVQPQALALLRP